MQTPAFKDWLRLRLEEMGWTNGDLERASGVSNSIIWRWQTEPTRRPTPANLKRIAPHLGVGYEDLMRMCGYLPGEPRAEVGSKRQAVREQLEQWLNAVGPENESYFWDYLKTHGDSAVDLIRQVRTAVSADGDGAVSAAVSERGKRGRRARKGPGGPLRPAQHHASEVLDVPYSGDDRRGLIANRRHAA